MIQRTSLVFLLLAIVACSGSDQGKSASTAGAASSVAPRGPDQLVLRIARTGGGARVFSYPKVDSAIWSATGAPAPARVLAFDEEAGAIAYVDSKGAPARIDFRQGVASTVTKAKVASLASWDGSNIYGVVADGYIERFGPSGTWRWKPRLPARALFPQRDGTLLALAQHGDSSIVWRLRPPLMKIADSVKVSRVSHALRTQMGDRLYLGSGRELTGVRTRTMQRTVSIRFDADIEQLETTPSGDRLFVVTKGATSVAIVDRYREAVSGHVDLGRPAADLRVDPLGRYLLARPEGTDSVLVIALGTNRVIGTVASAWREDLPFVGPDGSVALVQEADVVLVDGETLRPKSRVKDGAADFWYPFRWTGFRKRDARLDTPATFTDARADSIRRADSAAARDTIGRSPVPGAAPTPPRDTVRRSAGFTVSFAALLAADKARDLASQIHVGNESARVVTSTRDGSLIYRVVMGPYPTREEADRVGRDSKLSYWVYEGGP